jgi:hypothetical protein
MSFKLTCLAQQLSGSPGQWFACPQEAFKFVEDLANQAVGSLESPQADLFKAEEYWNRAHRILRQFYLNGIAMYMPEGRNAALNYSVLPQYYWTG